MKTVWILALAFTSQVYGAEESSTHPPIPVHFKLDTPGFITLVIDDANGKRVRNLLSDHEPLVRAELPDERLRQRG